MKELKDKFDNFLMGLHHVTPMSMEMTRDLITLGMSSNPELKEVFPDGKGNEMFDAINKTPMFRIFGDRLKNSGGLSIEYGALLLLSHFLLTPGAAVMWAYILHKKWITKPTVIITLQDLCKEFPIGFYSEEQMNLIWTAQKVPSEFRSIMFGDNLLDQTFMWE